jgi:hypothetical protein
MAAFATTAPAGSAIVPVMVPRSLCAKAGETALTGAPWKGCSSMLRSRLDASMTSYVGMEAKTAKTITGSNVAKRFLYFDFMATLHLTHSS